MESRRRKARNMPEQPEPRASHPGIAAIAHRIDRSDMNLDVGFRVAVKRDRCINEEFRKRVLSIPEILRIIAPRMMPRLLTSSSYFLLDDRL